MIRNKRALFTAGAVAVYLAAMLARLISARDLSLWPDEMTSLLFAKDSPWSQLRYDNNPPLFNILLKFWPARADEEFRLRLLPLIFFALTPPVTYFAARKAFGPAAALWSLALASIHAALFFHAVDLRTYSLFALASALNLYAFLALLQDGAKKIPHYVLSIALMALIHHFAVIPVAAQLFAMTWRGRDRSSRPGFTILALWGTVFLLGVWALQHVRLDAVSHLTFTPRWTALSFPMEVLRGGFSQTFWWVIVLALGYSYDRAPRMVEAAVVSLFSSTVIGLVTGLNPAQPNYYIFLAPYFVIAMGHTVADWKPRWKAASLAILIIALNLWIVRSHWNRDRGGWKEASQRIPPSPDRLIILLTHVSMKSPYFKEHRTFFPPPEEQTQDLAQELSPSREVWFLYPEDPRALDALDEFREKIFRFGFEEESSGVIKPDAEFPVRYNKLRRLEEKR